jgi:hypothetical protein
MCHMRCVPGSCYETGREDRRELGLAGLVNVPQN